MESFYNPEERIQGIANTPDTGPSTAILAAVQGGPGRVIINELFDNEIGKLIYERGIDKSKLQTPENTGFFCPRCKCEIRRFFYPDLFRGIPEIQILVHLCRDFATFEMMPAQHFDDKDWREFLRKIAATWGPRDRKN